MKIKPILLALFAGLLLSACSMVKNPTASTNFKRVKYRANLKLPKAKAEKQLTVTAFEANNKEETKVLKSLTTGNQLTQQMESNSMVTNDPWWESDPETWPWKEIILATIVVLLIILAVYLLVSFLGGVVGGIIGLILLLALLYLLFDYYG